MNKISKAGTALSLFSMNLSTDSYRFFLSAAMFRSDFLYPKVESTYAKKNSWYLNACMFLYAPVPEYLITSSYSAIYASCRHDISNPCNAPVKFELPFSQKKRQSTWNLQNLGEIRSDFTRHQDIEREENVCLFWERRSEQVGSNHPLRATNNGKATITTEYCNRYLTC